MRRRPPGLPPRLFVFACQNISPDVLQVIASQARAGTQHFYLHTPARAFWGDLDRWAALRAGARRRVPRRPRAARAPNPLLAAWGQAGRDFIAGLVGGEIVAPAFELAPLRRTRRATRCSAACRPTCSTTVAPLPRAQRPTRRGRAARSTARDASLQFHACHTRLREVQVLHDQLRALLEADAPDGGERLQPRDIAVLAPDIDAYAPHIEAVFGGALGSAREIPYTIADTSPLASAPVAAAFLRLLELPLRALTARRRARPACGARDRRALRPRRRRPRRAAGLARRRRRALGPGRRRSRASRRGRRCAYTFEFAIDRLLLGYASGDDSDIAGVAPWPRAGRPGRRRARWPAALARAAARRRDAPGRSASAGDLGARARNACSTTPSRRRATAPTPRSLRRLRECHRRLRRRARRSPTTTRRSNTRSCSNTCAANSAPGRRARAVPVRRRVFRPHGADAADPVPRGLPARHGRRRVPRARRARPDQPHRAARSTRANAASAIPRGAMPTAICSCSCSPAPAACCT